MEADGGIADGISGNSSGSRLWRRKWEVRQEKPDSVSAVFTGGIRGGAGMVRRTMDEKSGLLKKRCCASTVVEMAYLMPVVLLVWMLVIFALFYYHDKNIMSGAAYETAVVGSEWYHGGEFTVKGGQMNGGRTEDGQEDVERKLSRYFRDRVWGKMIFFGQAAVMVQVNEERIVVKAGASRRGLSLYVEKGAALTVPEEEIRKRRVLKQWGKELME